MVAKSVIVRLRAAGVGQFIGEFQRAGGAVGQTSMQIAQAASRSAIAAAKVARFAGIAGKALIVGLGAGLAISAKAAIDFESSFAGIQKTVDTSAHGFERLRMGMRDLALQIPVNVNELNRIGELGGQLNIAEDQLISFTKTIAELGVTTTLTTEGAALGFARLATILQVPQENFDRMGSAIVDLGNNFAATEDEILTFALRVAPIAGVVGMSVDQVLALSTAFSSVGVPAERGGTAVQRVLAEMSEAVLTGEEELASFAKTAGMLAGEFADLFERDAAAALEAFVSGLGEMSDEGGNVFAALDDVHLGTKRTEQALLAAAEAQGEMNRALELGKGAYIDNTALMEEAEKRFGTTASKMILAKNKFTDLRIEMGQKLLPMLGDIAETTGDVASAFSHLTDEQKLLVGQVVLGTAVLLLMVKAFLSATTHALGLRAAISSLAGSAGIGLLVYGLATWLQGVADVERKTRDLTEALKEQREGIEDAAADKARQDLEDMFSTEDITALNNFGLSMREIVEAMLEGGDALEGLTTKLDDLERRAQVVGQNVRGYAENGVVGQEIQGLDHTVGGVLELVARLRDYIGVVDEAKRRDLALVTDDALFQAELLQTRMEEARSGFFTFAGAAGTAEAATTDLGDAFDYTSDMAKEATDTLRELRNAQLASQNTALGFIDSVINLGEARAALNEEDGNTLQNMLALGRAEAALQMAFNALGTEGLQPVINLFQSMYEQNIINREELMAMLQVIAALGPIAANSASMAASGITSNMSVATEAIGQTSGVVQTLTGQMYGLNDAMGGAASGMTALMQHGQSVMAWLRSGWLDMAKTPMPKLQMPVLGNFDFSTFSKAFGSSVNRGFSSGISGAGGGVSKMLESELDKALKVAREGISKISGAIRAGFSVRTAQQGLKDARQELADLKEESLGMTDAIAAKEAEVALLKAESVAVTLDEARAIEESEEAYKRALAAYDQGLITQNTLLIYERDWQEALADSVMMSDDVAVAEEELAELRQREIDIVDELKWAEMGLYEAQLDVIDAQMNLIERGAEFAARTPEQVEAFKEIARAAGLTEDEINNLIDTMTRMAVEAFESSSFVALTANQAADAVSGAAARASKARWWPSNAEIAAGMAQLQSMLAGTTPMGTMTAAVAAASRGGGGGLNKVMHGGGRIPGPTGQEVNLRALSGEHVTPIGGVVGGGGNIDTLNLYIQGFWDLTRPDQITPIVDEFERELTIRGISRGGKL